MLLRYACIWHHFAAFCSGLVLILYRMSSLAGKMDSGRNHQGSLRSPMMVAWSRGKFYGARGYTTLPGGRPMRAPVNLPIPTRDQGCGDWWSEITRAKWAPGYSPGTPESPRGIHMWGWLVPQIVAERSKTAPYSCRTQQNDPTLKHNAARWLQIDAERAFFRV